MGASSTRTLTRFSVMLGVRKPTAHANQRSGNSVWSSAASV